MSQVRPAKAQEESWLRRVWSQEQVRAGALERQTGDLRHVLGRPATTLDEAVTAVLAPPAPQAGGPAVPR
ncbi:hypothetical protein [Streptomyces sp. NPDC048252]|uniref:hypothetical protein n=1 Tax=Streptomyces sp. NPDC048252 TaxID=3154612 RepID=UPI003433D472